MRSDLKQYECLVPGTPAEALEQKAAHPGLVPIAGGTDVLVWMNDGKLPARQYQSLHRLAPQWRYVRTLQDGGVEIGALATYTDVRHHEAIRAHYPLLVESARSTGALQIQNRGTLAGNVANGSPAADTVPVLMAYDAELCLVHKGGERVVPLSSFYTGYRSNVLAPGELISAIRLPAPRFPVGGLYFRKVGTREAQAISKVVFAGACGAAGVRMAWGSVAPVTLRSVRTEEVIRAGGGLEAAWQTLQQEISPIDDIRSTRAYRLAVSRNILADFLKRRGAS